SRFRTTARCVRNGTQFFKLTRKPLSILLGLRETGFRSTYPAFDRRHTRLDGPRNYQAIVRKFDLICCQCARIVTASLNLEIKATHQFRNRIFLCTAKWIALLLFHFRAVCELDGGFSSVLIAHYEAVRLALYDHAREFLPFPSDDLGLLGCSLASFLRVYWRRKCQSNHQHQDVIQHFTFHLPSSSI